MSNLIPTPYHAMFEAAMGPEGEFDDWEGFASAAVITNTKDEALAVRNGVTALDLSPMNKYKVTGPQAGEFLDYMMTRKISSMKDDRVAYVIWTNSKGKLIDDGTVFRFSEQEYIIKCGEDQTEHLANLSEAFDVNIHNATTESAGLSVQGAKSYALLTAAGAKNLQDLKAFQMTADTIAGQSVYISRTGFTGDLGYEIWSAPESVDAIWQALSTAPIELTPMGMTALDILRQECAYIIPGFDFGLADSGDEEFERTPAEMGLSWMVDLKRTEDFVGRKAIEAELADDSSVYQFNGVELEDTSDTGAGSLYETPVFSQLCEEIGLITSGGYSYGLQKNIGLATLKKGSVHQGDIVLVGEDKQKAKIVATPFFSTERRTQTPPA